MLRRLFEVLAVRDPADWAGIIITHSWNGTAKCAAARSQARIGDAASAANVFDCHSWQEFRC
jgi:hypothetical protein